jgi:hypothetical protein
MDPNSLVLYTAKQYAGPIAKYWNPKESTFVGNEFTGPCLVTLNEECEDEPLCAESHRISDLVRAGYEMESGVRFVIRDRIMTINEDGCYSLSEISTPAGIEAYGRLGPITVFIPGVRVDQALFSGRAETEDPLATLDLPSQGGIVDFARRGVLTYHPATWRCPISQRKDASHVFVSVGTNNAMKIDAVSEALSPRMATTIEGVRYTSANSFPCGELALTVGAISRSPRSARGYIAIGIETGMVCRIASHGFSDWNAATTHPVHDKLDSNVTAVPNKGENYYLVNCISMLVGGFRVTAFTTPVQVPKRYHHWWGAPDTVVLSDLAKGEDAFQLLSGGALSRREAIVQGVCEVCTMLERAGCL